MIKRMRVPLEFGVRTGWIGAKHYIIGYNNGAERISFFMVYYN
jgi:hypothetical protein